VTAPVDGWAKRAVASLFFTLFPSDCRICGSPLIRVSRLPVCENCLHAAQPLRGTLCGICGEACEAPAGTDPAAVRCRLCQRALPPFERAVAYGSYDRELRELVHLLKFDQVRPAAEVLGMMLAESIRALEPSLPAGTVAVIPVPLHSGKQAQRGFNQAEMIVRAGLRKLAGLERKPSSLGGSGQTPARRSARFELLPHTLLRLRDTGSQIGLSRHQRRENLRGAFAVKNATSILNRSVLLVDDVYTTGATASECARVLRRAGAARVWVATVARTLRVFDLPVVAEDFSRGTSAEPSPDRIEAGASMAARG